MDMIEKVARAICLAEGFDPDFNYDPNGLGAMAVSDVRWKLFTHAARAAIEAMREPDHDLTAAVVPVGYDRTHAVIAWRTMIDAALK